MESGLDQAPGQGLLGEGLCVRVRASLPELRGCLGGNGRVCECVCVRQRDVDKKL